MTSPHLGVAVALVLFAAPALARPHHLVRPAVESIVSPPFTDQQRAILGLPPAQQVEVACDKCATSEVVELLYRDVIQEPFVVGQGVEADRRIVSVDIKGELGAVQIQARDYLRGLGYVDSFAPAPIGDEIVHTISLPPPPKPPPPPPPPAKPRMVYSVWHPSWRNAGELASILAPLFPEGRFSAGGAAPSSPIGPSGGSGSPLSGGGGAVPSFGGGTGSGPSAPIALPTVAAPTDSLVFCGTAGDQARLREVFPQVDTPEAEVMVKASVFEVDLTTDDGSGFNLALGLLRQKIGVGINAQPTASASAAGIATSAATGGLSAITGNFLTFSDSNIDAVVSALTTDQRFHLVTSPSALARSGASTQLVVGQSVPIEGSVAYAGYGGSTPIQSVQYEDAGVVLTVRPTVHEKSIDVDLHQEISSFVQTTTGVNNTPTKQERDLDTSVTVQDGDVIAMAGLTQSDKGKTRSGLPGFLSFIGSSDRSNSRTDVLMVLQVVRLTRADGSATRTGAVYRRQMPAVPSLPFRSATE